ncbi:MAG: PQQ-binding-like beta-propeller repeat protein [Gammaproteobacteria bacterium]|nr:PQQ-binding-like beta-propeller repeat protein [Pseudomonadales bacterium]
MNANIIQRPVPLIAVTTLLFALLLPVIAAAQLGVSDGQWPSYAGDAGSTKYAALDQINADNFATLKTAWRWRSIDGDLDLDALLEINSGIRINNLQGTPLMIGQRLYMITALGLVAAIDARTGETLWRYNPESYLAGPTMSPISYHARGVAYWEQDDKRRVLVSTQDAYVLALDADTGILDPGFAEGRIDLTVGIPRAERDVLDWRGGQPLAVVSPPIVVGDILVTSQITSNRPRFKERPPLWIRGWHLPSGELAWVFHTIPQAGEFGVETWEQNSWQTVGNTGVWTMMSADPELGYVYLPIEAATDDFYGGHRPGDNLFSQSLVALDARTGKRVWHFQMVHHGIWDYDPPAAPNLLDVVIDGRPVKAVAQVTKQGFVFAFDRVTGEPLWPIEERPVPPAILPGEVVSPTQPFPTRPPAFTRQGLTVDDLIDFTPALRAEAEEILQNYTYGPLFTPPSLTEPGGNRGTILRPGTGGGANWSGAGVDPQTGMLYIPSSDGLTVPLMSQLSPDQANISYVRISLGGIRGPQGLPYLKPPYSTITAIDMNTGEIAWQTPNGSGDFDVENHPALQGLDLPPLGGGGRHPVLVTSSLLIHAQDRDDGFVLLARDKATGQELAVVDLPARPRGAPMTYMLDGRQYIGISVASEPVPEFLVLTLPE